MNPNQTKQPTREEFIQSLFLLEEKDNYLLGKEGITKIIKGIEKGCEVIEETYGSGGSNADIESIYQPNYETTNDGKKILDAIKLADRYENIGLNKLKEITEKIEKVSGNGRKTAVLLAGAILKEGMKSKLKPMALKETLDECLPIVLESLDKQSKEITFEDVGKVATIAGESKELGNIFQEIYTQIGKDGVIEIENSGISDTFYEIVDGVRFRHCGFMYPYMTTDEKGKEASYENMPILVVKDKISNITQLDRVLKAIYDSGDNKLVIFCDDIEKTVLGRLAYYNNGIDIYGNPSKLIKNIVIKAPTLWKDWLFEDIAKVTGAKIVDPANGTPLSSFANAWLGRCKKIIVEGQGKDGETRITGFDDITEYRKSIEEKGDNDSLLRASWLKTKTAILKLGANSESELSYKRGKALDARNSSYLALNGGVVAGGGLAYFNVIKDLPNTTGGKILKEALKAPLLQIIENSEKDCDIKLLGDKDGFDSKKGKIVDMWETGILDATTVVKNSFISALSVISTVLTTRPIITLKK